LLKLKKYTSKNSPYQLHIEILSNVECTNNFEQGQRERIFIKDICKRVLKSSTVLYVLRKEEKTLGFIALSVNSIDFLPSFQVDYLFVNNLYRGVVLEELDHTKTSIYLIEFAIEIAKEIQEKVGLRSLVLLPDSQRLEAIYKDIGFQKFPKKDWMFFKL